jgi:hypothetical protein
MESLVEATSLPCQEATKTPPDTKEKTMAAASAIADWRARHADSTTDERTVSCWLCHRVGDSFDSLEICFDTFYI